jgi:hypothetical protein
VPVQNWHVVYHQAPTGAQETGWITTEDVPVGDSYTLDHNLWMRPSYLYDRVALEELWAVSPPEILPPRYPARYMVDKYMHLLRYMPEAWASFNSSEGVPFGFFNQGWVDFQNASIVASACESVHALVFLLGLAFRSRAAFSVTSELPQIALRTIVIMQTPGASRS